MPDRLHWGGCGFRFGVEMVRWGMHFFDRRWLAQGLPLQVHIGGLASAEAGARGQAQGLPLRWWRGGSNTGR